MRRKRPLLYEVLGAGGGARVPDRSSGGGGATTSMASVPRTAAAGIRVSREFGAVVAAIAVVFIGLSYYLGTLHGSARGDVSRLARDTAVGSDGRDSEARSAPPALDAPYFTVRCLTRGWRTPEEQDRVEEECLAVVDFLRRKGYPDIDPRRDRVRRKIEICVGRSSDDGSLKPLEAQLASEIYQRRMEFHDCYITKITPPPPANR